MIKNYTSEVPADRSISNIEKYLVLAGATDISKKYENGNCEAITFRLTTNGGAVFFKLPAQVNACYKILLDQRTHKNRPDVIKFAKEQAARTAWKLISDWVQVQLSMIELQQADAVEIFLPYVYDPAKDETFYQRLKSSGFKQLTNG